MDINQELEKMAETMEKSTKAHQSKLDLVKATVLKLGRDGLKKAVPTLSDEQRALLGEVLEDMKKSASNTLEPKSDTTDAGDQKENTKKPRQDKADEELVDEAKKKGQAEVRHQGGTPVEGWEGQVIKSKEGNHSKKKEEIEEEPKMEKSAPENPEGKKEDAEVKKEPMMTVDDRKKAAKTNLKKMLSRMQERKMEKSACVSKLAKSLEVSEDKVAAVWDELAKAYKMEAPSEAAAQSPVPAQMKGDADAKVQEGEDSSVPKYKDKSAKQTESDKKPMSGKSPETADEGIAKAPHTGSMKKSETYFTEDEAMYVAKSDANPFAQRTIGQNKHYKVDDYIALEHASKELRLKKSTFDYAPAGSEILSKSMEGEDPAMAQVKDNAKKKSEADKQDKAEIRQIKTDEQLKLIQDKAGPKMPMVKAKMKKSWVEGIIETNLDMNASQAFVAQTNVASTAEGAKLVKSFNDDDMDALFAEQDMFKTGK